ncbi:peptidoglycan bridge formation glycyltransferase FemA/FemB family protein [Candidatus Roizmanbacteria bacterium]|nr:peptidoglycan bridge formation glycyltransferase FemA/FemB family protein [Candidatus Roizmanbacteria bacterium]
MIKEITSQFEWTSFFNEAGSPSFLHSWEWGEFQTKLGYGVLRLAITDDSVIPAEAGIQSISNIIAICQVIKIKAKRGNMLFIPHGPIFVIPAEAGIQTKNIIDELKKYLIDIAKREDFSFIRMAPIFQDSKEHRETFTILGFRTAPIYMHAERLWVLDISKDEDTLLKEMRKTTRYSIRKAEKEGVTVVKRTDEKALREFQDLYNRTAARENFTAYSPSYLKHEYDAFHRTENANWFFAYEKDGKLTAAALIDYTKSTAFYHQGATLHSKVPTSYLLQWESIKEAKRRGCTHYNFWGTLQPGRTPKNWGGLSLFKEGFGGYQVDYVPTQDLILSPKYWITYLYELYLKWRRGV